MDFLPCERCGHIHRWTQCDDCECNTDFPLTSEPASFDPDIPTAEDLGFVVEKDS